MLDALELKPRLSVVPALPGIRTVDITSKRLENIMKNAGHFRPSSTRHYWIYAVLLALFLLPGGGLLVHAWQDSRETAEPEVAPSISQEAEQAVARRDWNVAAEKFRELTEQNAANERAWFMLGYCLHANGQLDEAIVAHRRAATFPKAKRTAMYNLACAYALKSDRDAAIDALQQAIDAGFISPIPISKDADFALIKEDPAFLELVEAARPPVERDVYRQLDFWVGKWDVFCNHNQKVGTNVITKDEKGFLLTEKWSNVKGDTGTSINYYDPSDKHWKQTWVDASGNIVHYRGGFTDGKMSLEGPLTKPNGEVERSRVSFSPNPNGSIRQVVERSNDGGKTWDVYFDGNYVRQVSDVDRQAERRVF